MGRPIDLLHNCEILLVTIDLFEHSVTSALAVATSIVVMQFAETVHPPGGATALIAVTTQSLLPWANFLHIFVLILTGSIIFPSIGHIPRGGGGETGRYTD
jgi:CBS-domain-containing membrane protein